MMRGRPSRQRALMASHQHRVLLYTTCYNVLDGYVGCVILVPSRRGAVYFSFVEVREPFLIALFRVPWCCPFWRQESRLLEGMNFVYGRPATAAVCLGSFNSLYMSEFWRLDGAMR